MIQKHKLFNTVDDNITQKIIKNLKCALPHVFFSSLIKKEYIIFDTKKNKYIWNLDKWNDNNIVLEVTKLINSRNSNFKDINPIDPTKFLSLQEWYSEALYSIQHTHYKKNYSELPKKELSENKNLYTFSELR